MILKILFTLFSFSLFANVGLPTLEFSNKAECAKQSQLPATSAFVLLDNVDLARAYYRILKSQNSESVAEKVKDLIIKYRQANRDLLGLISQRIFSGQLPLIEWNASEAEDALECHQQRKCQRFFENIEKRWHLFSAEKRFFPQYLLKEDFKGKKIIELSCVHLKKFGPLESELFGVKPDEILINQIGDSLLHREQYLDDCRSSKVDDLNSLLWQIELPVKATKEWNEIGYVYWRSLQIYYSWAYRYSEEFKKLSYPYFPLIRQSVPEDSVMFIPKGCRTIQKKECSIESLNINALREFAKASKIKPEFPDDQVENLLSKRGQTYEKDYLKLGESKSSDAWSTQFYKKWSDYRSMMREKFLNAMTKMNLIEKQIGLLKLVDLLENSIHEPLSNKELDGQVRSDLYALCSEFNLGGNEKISFVFSKIEKIKNYSKLDPLLSEFGRHKFEHEWKDFTLVANRVLSFCGSLESLHLWDGFEFNKQLYMPWLLERFYQDKNIESLYENSLKIKLSNKDALVKYKKSQNGFSNAVCADQIDCLRVWQSSVIDLYQLTQYLELVFPAEKMFSSSDFFNPYSEMTACQIYDPWFKSKSSWFNLGVDLAQGAVSSVVPYAVFASAELNEKKITSFETLVKDNKIFYSPSGDLKKVDVSAIADFGPLTGVPCAISISKRNPYIYNSILQFSGISTRACIKNEDYELNVYSSSNMSQIEKKNNSQCLVCTLNFESITTSLVRLSSFFGAPFYVVRGFLRLIKGLNDPVDIPRSWSLNLNLVQSSKLAFGDIPGRCLKKLLSQQACMPTKAQEFIVEQFLQNGWGSVTKIDLDKTSSRKKVYIVKTDLFEVPFHLLLNEERDEDGTHFEWQILDGPGGIR